MTRCGWCKRRIWWWQSKTLFAGLWFHDANTRRSNSCHAWVIYAREHPAEDIRP